MLVYAIYFVLYVQVRQRMEDLQAQIIDDNKSVKSAIVSPATFHLTMMVIDLQADHRDRSVYTYLPSFEVHGVFSCYLIS